MGLSELIRRVAVQEDVPAILDTAVDGLRGLVGADVAFAATSMPEFDTYRVASSRGTVSAAFADIEIRPMAGLGGRVAVSHKAMAVFDFLSDEAVSKGHLSADLLRDEALRSLTCVPAVTATGVHSLLYAGNRRPGYLSARAFADLTALGTIVGVAIDQCLAQDRLRRLSVLRERQRLATTLHDSVAQSLFTIGVEAKRAPAADPNRVAASLREIEALAAQASRELRETLHRINAAPRSLPLESALDAEARSFEQHHGVTARVVCDGLIDSLPPDHETLIIDTAREGLRNAVKHADAKLILVHLRSGDRGSQLIVQSDGWRSAARPTVADFRGGLRMLRTRAEALRGVLDLEFGEEGEAIVRLEFPRSGGPTT